MRSLHAAPRPRTYIHNIKIRTRLEEQLGMLGCPCSRTGAERNLDASGGANRVLKRVVQFSESTRLASGAGSRENPEVVVMSLSRVFCSVVVCLSLGGCATVVAAPSSESGPVARNTAKALGIPPGHLPPPGECRVWIPGTPPGRQAGPRSCDGIMVVAPAGSWVLYRPGRSRKEVGVRHIHSDRAGVVVQVRIFQADTGEFLREERPGRSRR